MKNFAKKTVARTQEFVTDHKTALTIIATATVTTVAIVKFKKMVDDGYAETVNEFLNEKGLMTEFTTRYFEDVE